MVEAFDFFDPESDFGFKLGYGVLLHYATRIGLPRRGATTVKSWSGCDDVDLLLDGAPGSWRCFSWFSKVAPEVASLDQFFDLILEVMAVLCVVAIVTMEPVIFRSVLVSSFQGVGLS